MSEYRPGGFQVLPPLVKNLIFINVLVAVVEFILYKNFDISLADYLGLHYFRSELFKPWQLITHLFMHGGNPADVEGTILHLFSNMFALWMFGSILENRWGPQRFLTFYIVCGLGAALCHLGVLSLQYEPVVRSYETFVINPTLDQFNLFIRHHMQPGAHPGIIERLSDIYGRWMNDPGNTLFPKIAQQRLHDYVYGTQSLEGAHLTGILDEPTVGASGAVFGVLFAFGYLFPNLQLMFIFPPIPIKAKWFVTIYAVFELYAGIRNSAGDNVAHFAHLGGMLFAFLLLKLWRYRFENRSF